MHHSLLITLWVFLFAHVVVQNNKSLRKKAHQYHFYPFDDQAWGDYSFMDHPHIQTPHIDQLAKESATFTRVM